MAPSLPADEQLQGTIVQILLPKHPLPQQVDLTAAAQARLPLASPGPIWKAGMAMLKAGTT